MSDLQYRPDRAPDAVRTVKVRVELTDAEIAEAFCNRGDRNQSVIINRIAENFRDYPMQTDYIGLVDTTGEALTPDAVSWLEKLASSARESLNERQSKAVLP